MLPFFAAAALQAQQTDTLSFYKPGSGYVYFRNSEITVQAARFINPAPGYLKEISLSLGGVSADGSARLRIFGHEGGVPVPIFEEDLIDPIFIKKSRTGFEKITVTLPQPLFLENNQFFVALDRIDSGVVFLSDQLEKAPFCDAGGDSFHYQLLKEGEKGWRWEKYAFAVDAVMEFPSVAPSVPMGDVAVELGILDTVTCNRSIAWGDVDDDGFVDLLWDGRLYMNREGKHFERMDREFGLSGSPAANLFLDADNDGHLDILFIGSHDKNDLHSRLFLAGAGPVFRRVDLDLPPFDNPTSFSVADADGDGYLDVFIGQGIKQLSGEEGEASSAGREPNGENSPLKANQGRLLLNRAGKGFTDASGQLPSFVDGGNNPTGEVGNYGSQFVDVDRDGDPDLYIARRYPGQSRVLYNDGTGHFAAELLGGEALALGAGSGGDWKDFDNDGDPDLLYPRLIHPYLRKYRDAQGSGIYMLNDRPENGGGGPGGFNPVEYEERHAGGTWGDVNNDGLLDAFFTTFGDCRFAELYVQNQDNTFTPQTFAYGLHWSSAGEDALWVDYDNDGWLDLCAIEWNRLRIHKNPGDGGHSRFVELDPVLPGGASDVGASVTLYSGDLRITREVTVGRGILMGDSPRLHYGLGPGHLIDSVIVTWSNGTRERFTDLKPNGIHRLVRGSAGAIDEAGNVALSAVPNPFSDQLHIYYSIPRAQHVRLEIYNQVGTLVITLLDEEVSAGDHSVVWDAVDGLGEKVSGGAYIYRLVYGNGETSGRAVLTR